MSRKQGCRALTAVRRFPGVNLDDCSKCDFLNDVAACTYPNETPPADFETQVWLESSLVREARLRWELDDLKAEMARRTKCDK
jgi:hypothetical protein